MTNDEIFRLSLFVFGQRSMKVAFQGERGAYSEAAAIEYFGEGLKPIACESFDDVFAQVENGNVTHGIVPVENSLGGSIHRNYDLLLRHHLHIIGEKIFRVRHCLIAQEGVKLGEIKKVISHPQALAQCEHYLKNLGVTVEPVYDTAGAVKMLKERGERHTAAIASSAAARVYGMTVVQEGIEDDEANFTRFLILNHQPVSFSTKPSKTSIVFSLKNVPGALFKAMSVFALREIDLTKIESRPIAGQMWEYMFYLDFVGSSNDEVCQRAVAHLGEMALTLRVLGSYPRDV